MKLDVLVFAAHPDDAELGCAGTIAAHIAQGKKVGVIDFTMGELGTRGNAITRTEEANAAAEILNLSLRQNMGFADGFFMDNKEHQLKLIKMIRTYRPEVILANAPQDRHIDHGRAAKLAQNACFLSGLAKIEIQESNQQYLKPWRPKALYHYIQDNYLSPDLVVDISDFWEKKMESILAFKTQFYDPNSDSKEAQTPISGQDFLDFLEARAREMGRSIGVKYGEGFVKNRPVGVRSLMEVI